MNLLTVIMMRGGLEALRSDLIKNWLGPAFLIIMGLLAIRSFAKKEFRSLIGIVLVGTIVALIVYDPGSWFGENGNLTKISKDAGSKIAN